MLAQQCNVRHIVPNSNRADQTILLNGSDSDRSTYTQSLANVNTIGHNVCIFFCCVLTQQCNVPHIVPNSNRADQTILINGSDSDRSTYTQSLANLNTVGHNVLYILLLCAYPTRQYWPYCAQLEPGWPKSVYRWLLLQMSCILLLLLQLFSVLIIIKPINVLNCF